MDLGLLVGYTSLARDGIYNEAREKQCQQEAMQAVFT
jgi:hypothetical protein